MVLFFGTPGQNMNSSLWEVGVTEKCHIFARGFSKGSAYIKLPETKTI